MSMMTFVAKRKLSQRFEHCAAKRGPSRDLSLDDRVTSTDAQRDEYQLIVNAIASNASVADVKTMYLTFVRSLLRSMDDDSEEMKVFNYLLDVDADEEKSLKAFWLARKIQTFYDLDPSAFRLMFHWKMPVAPHVEVFNFFHQHRDEVSIPEDMVLTYAFETVLKHHLSVAVLDHLLGLCYDWHFLHSPVVLIDASMRSIVIECDDEEKTAESFLLQGRFSRPSRTLIKQVLPYEQTTFVKSPTLAYLETVFRFVFANGCPCDFSQVLLRLPYAGVKIVLDSAFEQGLLPSMMFATDILKMVRFSAAKRIALLEQALSYGVQVHFDALYEIIDMLDALKDAVVVILGLADEKTIKGTEDTEPLTLQAYECRIKDCFYLFAYLLNHNLITPPNQYCDEDDDELCVYDALNRYAEGLAAAGLKSNDDWCEMIHGFISDDEDTFTETFSNLVSTLYNPSQYYAAL